MHQVKLEEAKKCLPELIEEVAAGSEVVITRTDGKSFKIIPIPSKRTVPKFGSAKGLIKISEDFDDPIPGFEDYTP